MIIYITSIIARTKQEMPLYLDILFLVFIHSMIFTQDMNKI